MSEMRFGEWQGRLVASGDRLRHDLDRLRERERDQRGEDRRRRLHSLAQTRARIHFSAPSSMVGAELMLARLHGDISALWVPVWGPVASLPAPSGAIASTMATRWRVRPPDGYNHHAANVAYKRWIEPARGHESTDFYYYKQSP